MKNKNIWVFMGAVLGFLGVVLGAFGAHILETKISPEMMEIFNTGILYHLIHTAVLIALASAGNERYFKALYFFTTGILLFSFSLYIYSVTNIAGFAIITPLGGISFLIGWVLTAFEGFRVMKKPGKI